MDSKTLPPWLIVTPAQYHAGYHTRTAQPMTGVSAVTRRDYVLVRQQANGDYIVRNPDVVECERELSDGDTQPARQNLRVWPWLVDADVTEGR